MSKATASSPMSEEEKKPEMMLPPPPQQQAQVYSDFLYLEPSDSIPKLHTESSCSEHVLSPEFACEREVQSEAKMNEWEKSSLNFPFNYQNASGGAAVDSAFLGCGDLPGSYDVWPLQDMLLYKPF